MDGRRHSVDVPISRTLIALRRVRSLRDPSTNSLSKLSALVDNLNWETNSNNDLGFENGFSNYNAPRLNSSLYREKEQLVSEHEARNGSRNCKSRLLPPETFSGLLENTGSTPQTSLCLEGSDAITLKQEGVCANKALGERYCNDCGEKGLELIPATPYIDFVEGGGSCNGQDKMSRLADKRRHGGSKQKGWRRKHGRFSRVTAGDNWSRIQSPCLSISDTSKEGSICGMSFSENEDVGIIEYGHQGCGLSSCWSRTLRFKESDVLPDVEEQPLLLGSASPIRLPEENTDWKHKSGASPYPKSPRSFCQKFMPKSFDELVGQNIVARSLLSAICNNRISSLYFLHGPRGTGKTSASRVFAAALNCLSSGVDRPCGVCQECVMFFAGRSRDVNEVDSLGINRIERCRSVIKNAAIPPVFSRFKIYIIDDCHLLRKETWAIILNSLEGHPQHVVFIMITPDFDKIPRSAVSKSQRYHFQKVKEADITSKLAKICVEEGLDFDQDALNFIATKSNGSLRDAEMTLEQLSLLGNKITLSLVYDVKGVVSDDELLDLLYLALSSDASNTVKKARELMRSRIDPLQLVSQLANLIMDILAGKCPDGISDARRKLFGTDNTEADMQQLSHALKILSQTEKQLRMSKNQSTWLTVALLQLSSAGSSHEGSEPRLSLKTLQPQDDDFLSTSSTGESMKHPVISAHENGDMRMQDSNETLELVWKKATGICTSSSLKKFLQKRGKLVSVGLSQGIAVAALDFDCPDSVSKAEKSWKAIATALQHILGHNVELRINLARNTSNKYGKFKKPSFNLFNCSRRLHLKSHLSTESGGHASDNSDITPKTVIARDKYVEACSSECGSQLSRTCCNGKDLFKIIRNNDGNALSVGVSTPNRSLPENVATENKLQAAYPLNGEIHSVWHNSIALKPESQTGARRFLKMHCWRTAMLPFRKAWKQKHQPQNEQFADYALPCAAATTY